MPQLPASVNRSAASAHTPAKERIVAVVVAWNREVLLRDTLNGLAAQTRPLDAIIVIDNASTDASAEVAASYSEVTQVVTMPQNLGGAGGFAAGIALAVTRYAADWVWIMDDDTAPQPDALAQLLHARDAYPGQPALLAAKAIWTDGREHPMNRPRPRPLLDPELRAHARQIDCIPIRSASFVAPLIDARAIRADGLPTADYFLWNDDFEYTARILRHRVGLYVPAAIVLHQTKKFGDSSADPGARFFNEVRNKIWTFTRSQALNPLETLLYGGRTLLRWGQTVAASSDPAALLRYGWKGLAAGAQAPRATLAVLQDTPAAQATRELVNPCCQSQLDSTIAAEFAAAQATAKHSHPSAPFTVLMSVYAGDQPAAFSRAFTSITADQTLRPRQVVLVQDGPVPAALATAIDTAIQASPVRVTRVNLPENRGLARALNAGLKHCDYEVVARADADDISLPERFATQLPLMRDHDLIGSALVEFAGDENSTGMVRQLPTEAAAIAQTARFRDPFNHPTVVFRKSAVAAAGGYQHLERMEDYLLFARMIHLGARTANLAQPLVKYRVDAGAYTRRGGRAMFQSEVALQRALHQEGFTTLPQYARNLAIRAGYRLVPEQLRRSAYRTVGKLAWFKDASTTKN